eukprot:1148621-Amphidinium_carterae.1
MNGVASFAVSDPDEKDKEMVLEWCHKLDDKVRVTTCVVISPVTSANTGAKLRKKGRTAALDNTTACRP